MGCGGSQDTIAARAVWPGESVPVVLPQADLIVYVIQGQFDSWSNGQNIPWQIDCQKRVAQASKKITEKQLQVVRDEDEGGAHREKNVGCGHTREKKTADKPKMERCL